MRQNYSKLVCDFCQSDKKTLVLGFGDTGICKQCAAIAANVDLSGGNVKHPTTAQVQDYNRNAAAQNSLMQAPNLANPFYSPPGYGILG